MGNYIQHFLGVAITTKQITALEAAKLHLIGIYLVVLLAELASVLIFQFAGLLVDSPVFELTFPGTVMDPFAPGTATGWIFFTHPASVEIVRTHVECHTRS
jgi:hypothetical protein